MAATGNTSTRISSTSPTNDLPTHGTAVHRWQPVQRWCPPRMYLYLPYLLLPPIRRFSCPMPRSLAGTHCALHPSIFRRRPTSRFMTSTPRRLWTSSSGSKASTSRHGMACRERGRPLSLSLLGFSLISRLFGGGAREHGLIYVHTTSTLLAALHPVVVPPPPPNSTRAVCSVFVFVPYVGKSIANFSWLFWSFLWLPASFCGDKPCCRHPSAKGSCRPALPLFARASRARM